MSENERDAQEPSADIRSRFYGSSGETLDYVYEIEGDVLTIWCGERGSPAYLRSTFDASGDVLDGGWVYPGGGGYPSTATRIARWPRRVPVTRLGRLPCMT